MLLYLVRHGEAVSEREDPARPLSAEGRREVKDIASLAAGHFSILPGYIYHSPKLRAVQTARILAETIGSAPGPREHSGLLPMDDPGQWVDSLSDFDRDLMLVGHLPFMGRLASLLLTWDAGASLVEFSTGTVLCLEEAGGWHVKWMVSPASLKPGPGAGSRF
jgi:phosphohistidine phosphatase